MEAEAKQAPMVPAGLLFSCPPFSLFRLRRPILRSIAQVQAKYEEVEKGTKSWLAEQPFAVEATVCGASAAFQSAVAALSVSYLAGDQLRLPDFSSLPLLKPLNIQSQVSSSSPFVDARNFAVMEGANEIICCSMRRIRGKEDLQGRMVAGFGSGAVFSIVSGMGGGSISRQAAFAVSSGVFFAALRGGLFQIGQAISVWSSKRPGIEAKVVTDSVPSRQSQGVVDIAPSCQNISALDKFTAFQRDLLSDGTLAMENSLRPLREASLQMALCMPLLTDTSSELKKLHSDLLSENL
ncbi:uncharacterized protein LOC144561615 [Carex rostrata]